MTNTDDVGMETGDALHLGVLVRLHLKEGPDVEGTVLSVGDTLVVRMGDFASIETWEVGSPRGTEVMIPRTDIVGVEVANRDVNIGRVLFLNILAIGTVAAAVYVPLYLGRSSLGG